jgi:hypothetical protein
MVRDIALELLGKCNYKCWYCVGDAPGGGFPEPALHDLDRLREIYGPLGEETYTTIYARGSEPCIHPQVADVLWIVSRSGRVLISTNLSRPVSEWLVNAPRVDLLVTLHPEATTDIDGFFSRVQGAVAAGCNVTVQALDHEPCADWVRRVTDAGVTQKAKVWPIRETAVVAARDQTLPVPPVGVLCTAGYDAARIGYPDPRKPKSGATTLFRCTVTNLPIKQLLVAPEPCPRPYADKRCYMRLVDYHA